jgi:hypothetical protein
LLQYTIVNTLHKGGKDDDDDDDDKNNNLAKTITEKQSKYHELSN